MSLLQAELNVLQADWRKIAVLPDDANPSQSVIYDFGLTGSARYVQNGTNLTVDLASNAPFAGGSILVAPRPGHNEFVVTTSGQVVDENMQQTMLVDQGTFSFNLYTWSQDGSTLYGLTFQNSPVLRVYDAEHDYAFIKEDVLNNQVSPVAMFTDDEAVILVSIVFVNNTVKTLITSIALQ